MRRAQHPEQKETRRQDILAGAARLFSGCPYDDLRMADLARQLGLAKGTVYLYFPSKESLFLAVLQAEMGAWFRGAGARLEAVVPGLAPVAVAAGLVDELLEHPRLPSLQALVHGVLERNVHGDEALAFGRFLQDGVTRVGGLLERAIPDLPPGQGVVFLMRFYSLVIGTWLMSSRPPAVRAALADPGLGMFDFEFADVFRGAVTDLLNGMLQPALSLAK